jgi:hypothetical protein
MNKWTRRSLLVGGAIVALPTIGFGLGRFLCSINRMPRALNPVESLTMIMYPDIASARALGKKYLEQSKSTARAALRRIHDHKRIRSSAQSGCLTKAMLAVEQACREDFRSKRTYCIDGWVLAQTELDLAALCTLAQMPRAVSNESASFPASAKHGTATQT